MVTRKRRNMCMILDRLNFLTNVRSRVIISPNNKTERNYLNKIKIVSILINDTSLPVTLNFTNLFTNGKMLKRSL